MFANKDDCFIIIDYDDRISLDYVCSRKRDFLKIKELDEIEKFVEVFVFPEPWSHTNRILQKSDNFVINDIFEYFKRQWVFNNR